MSSYTTHTVRASTLRFVGAHRIFLARLAGLPVWDPSADQLGRVRDVLLRIRRKQQPPRITGLLVEVQYRRQIFIPVGRVLSFTADAIMLATASVDLRQFTQRPGEVRALGEMLDRVVTIQPSGERATVVDLGAEETPAHTWLVTRAAVREITGRFARRGHLQQVPWEELDGIDEGTHAHGAQSLLAAYETLHPADLAHALHELPPQRRTKVAFEMGNSQLADVLSEMPDNDQTAILTALSSERAADVLEMMNPDDAADLIRRVETGSSEHLLTLMRPSDAADVRRLLHYPDNTAGGMMTTEPVILTPDATVADALARIRTRELAPALASQVYVCRAPTATPTGRYIGTSHFQRLLREAPSELVSAVLDVDIEPIAPEASLEEVARMLATYDLTTVPVVDENDRLLGAVTVDDVLDAMLPLGWREREYE